MATNEELRTYIESLEDRIKVLEPKNDEKISDNKKFEGIKYFDVSQTSKAHIKLPVFTTAPTYTGKDGEMVFVDDGTLNYIVVYKDVVWNKIGLTYAEIAYGGSGVGGSTSSWIDWDISAAIPAGALYAEISMRNRDAAEYLAGVRKDGSALDRYQYVSDDSQNTMLVEVGTSRIIERYSSHANVNFSIFGYWI